MSFRLNTTLQILHIFFNKTTICYDQWMSNFIQLLHLLTYVVRHHPGTANIFEPQGLWQKHFKYNKSLSLSRYTLYKCDKASEGPYKMKWFSPCLRSRWCLSIGPSRSEILKHVFFFWECVGRSTVATKYLWWFSFYQDEWTRFACSNPDRDTTVYLLHHNYIFSRICSFVTL